jgi:cyclopropane fatty-acyl-phospholipid synthase-like methyltransferase
MDIWKFYAITHLEHDICNPTSDEKLARLVKLVRLDAGAPVVDIACGKGEFLIRLAESYGVRGLGIDISPYCIADAERRLQERSAAADVTFRQMDGADFKPERPHSFALASCIGASWVFGGHAGTLDFLTHMVEPGGWVVVGEVFWLREPSEEYLQASGITRDMFGTHVSNAEDDWDKYEGLQWYATTEYARAHPDDPDLPELTSRVAKSRASYLRWGRDTVGWAMYVFRRTA